MRTVHKGLVCLAAGCLAGGASQAATVSGDKLILDGPTAAKIFQGTIKTWNDPAIAALNPGVTLPSAPIQVFFRSDESGTTENFAKYLKAAGGGAWTGEPAKKWTGTGSGKEKSAGVAEGVKSSKNSITYVEWSYAVDNKLGIAQIDNGSGTPVELSADSAGKALAAAKPAGTGSDLALKLAGRMQSVVQALPAALTLPKGQLHRAMASGWPGGLVHKGSPCNVGATQSPERSSSAPVRARRPSLR